MKLINPYVFVCLVLGIFLINFMAQASPNPVPLKQDGMEFAESLNAQEETLAAAEWEAVMDFLDAGADKVAGPGGGRAAHCNAAGVASYYGPGFHGRRTASGQVFNANGLTAAHRYLPFGTMVKVTSAASGRSVTVRINDRGPFSHGRIIDLSAGAARAIGLSLGKVRLECL